jgi:hypothetical protein
VPKTYVNPSNMRLALPGGGSEPTGTRIVELPEDEYAAVARDPRSGFVAYAPKGSIAKGETLVTTGGGETTPCTICHGPALRGIGATPGIQSGSRGSGPQEALMHNVVQRLTTTCWRSPPTLPPYSHSAGSLICEALVNRVNQGRNDTADAISTQIDIEVRR